MNHELQALEQNGTWEITDLSHGKKPIGCKQLFKLKYKADGSIEKHKARHVIQRCRQTKGTDYEETFAPIAKMTTIRAILVVAAIKDQNVYQMNVSNAFLHGDLYEEVYMSILKSYCGQGKRASATSSLYTRTKCANFKKS